jgi:hypothetical protein
MAIGTSVSRAQEAKSSYWEPSIHKETGHLYVGAYTLPQANV